MPGDIEKMQRKAVEIRSKYAKASPKQWDVEQVFMGMVKDVGDLSKLLMQYRGYRKAGNDTRKRLEHELSDVLYSLLVIADKTGIDIEKSFWKTMSEIDDSKQ